MGSYNKKDKNKGKGKGLSYTKGKGSSSSSLYEKGYQSKNKNKGKGKGLSTTIYEKEDHQYNNYENIVAKENYENEQNNHPAQGQETLDQNIDYWNYDYDYYTE